jgi:hypothetical protein
MTIEPFDLKQQVDQCLHRNSPLTRRVRNASMLVVLTLYSAHLVAQSHDPAASKGTLYQTISQLDADLFGAMNRCDMVKFASYWAEDLEFYQDKDGLSVGRKAMVDSTRKNVCGKFLRELVPGTLEVHPIPGYGAIEIGVHRFPHPYAQEHGLVGEAKFMNVWRLKDGRWQVTRAFSFDHALAK